MTAPPRPGAPARASLYRILMTACGMAAATMFAAIAVLVCLDVFLRNTGIAATPWSMEVTEYLLMTATFVAAPWLLYLGDHIRVDVALRTLPAPAVAALDRFANLFGMIVCGTLAWQAAGVAGDARAQGGMVFKVLVFPEWWLALPMIVGCSLLTIEFARRLFSRPAGSSHARPVAEN